MNILLPIIKYLHRIIVCIVIIIPASLYAQNCEDDKTVNTNQNNTHPTYNDKLFPARKSVNLLTNTEYNATVNNNKYFRAWIENCNGTPTNYSGTQVKMPKFGSNDANFEQLNTNLLVGSTQNTNISVTPNGAATYSVPFFMPPGTGGMQPELSITYNSQSGNGIVGYGWSLAGLSSVSRTGKDRFRDDEIRSFENSNQDNISLDGNRLILLSGTHWSAGAIYGTETGNTIRVYLLQDANDNNNLYFKSVDKTGNIKYYGYKSSTDSKVQLSYNNGTNSTSSTVSWLLSRSEDNNGNYIRYNYKTENNEHILDKIEYTGNDYIGLKPYVTIQLSYTQRADNNLSFIPVYNITVPTNPSSSNCAHVKNNYLLDEVSVRFESRQVRRYQFVYYSPSEISNSDENTVDFSYLKEIYEFGENGGQINGNEHYNPIRFKYFGRQGTLYKEITSESAVTVINNQYGSQGYWSSGNYPEYVFGDFNGDGLQDKVVIERNVSISGQNKSRWYLLWGTYKECGDGQDCGEMDFIPATTGVNNKSLMITYDDDIGGNLPKYHLWPNRSFSADVNNDGYDDLIITSSHRGFIGDCMNCSPYDEHFDIYVEVFLSDGKKIAATSAFGKSTISTRENLSGGEYWVASNYSIMPADLDGDSRLELVLSANSRWCDWGFWDDEENNRFTIQYIKLYNGTQPISNPTASNKQVFTDVFNDNCGSLFTSNWGVLFSRAYCSTMPLTGDGKTDIVVFYPDNSSHSSPLKMEVFSPDISSSNWLNSVYTLNNINEVQAYSYNFGDINGDGLIDMAYTRTFSSDNNLYIRYNIGNGSFSEEYNVNDYIPDDITFKSSYLLSDFNGDGKADILNMFQSSGSSSFTAYQMLYSVGFNKFSRVNFNGNTGTNFSNKGVIQRFTDKGGVYGGVRMRDFNGDGCTDIIVTKPYADDYLLSFNDKNKDFLLQAVADGSGNWTSINYDNICKGSPIYDTIPDSTTYLHTSSVNQGNLRSMAYGVTVVSGLTNHSYNTPPESTLPDHDISTTNYHYFEKITHKKKGFSGFRKFESVITDPNNCTAGKAKNSKEFILNTTKYELLPFRETESIILSPTTERLIKSSEQTFSIKTVGSSYFFVPSNAIRYDHIKGMSITNSVNSNDIDDYENILKSTETTTNEFNSLTNSKIVATVFFNPYSPGTLPDNLWCPKAYVAQESTKHTTNGDAIYSNQEFTECTTFTYNTNLSPYWWAGYKVTKTIKGAKVDGSGFLDTQSKDLVTDFLYDIYGNIIHKKNYAFGTNGTPSGIEVWASHYYDTKGRFVIKDKDRLDDIVTRSYNEVNGLARSSTDTYGKTTVTNFDGFGFVVSVTNPYGEKTYYEKKFYSPTNDNNRLFYQKEWGDNKPLSVTYYNSHHKQYTETDVLNGKKVISDDADYCASGRILKQYPKRFTTDSRTTVTELEYDEIGRTISTELQSTLATITQTTIFNDYTGNSTPPSVKTIEDNAVEKKITFNGVGLPEIIEENDGASNGVNKLLFTYTALNKTRSSKTVILDVQPNNHNHALINEYDDYGNLTKTMDPDAGTYIYAYDAFNNIVQQNNPNGYVIEHVYRTDGREDYTQTKLNGTVVKTVKYTYVAQGTNGASKIATVQMVEGSNPNAAPAHKITYTYDDFGRTIKTEETITKNGATSTFVTKTIFNSKNQVESIIYPSQIKIRYDYNSIGLNTEIWRTDISPNVRIWQVTDADCFARTLQENVAHGAIINTLEYDALGYMTSTKSENNSTTLFHQEYDWTYETKTMDKRRDMTRNLEEIFSYDDLNRLTGHVVGATSSATQYYPDGSINFKTAVGEYEYKVSNNIAFPVHGVKQILPNGQNFYDRPLLQTVSYNETNRPSSITENGKTLEMMYGIGEDRIAMSYSENSVLKSTKYYIGTFERTQYHSTNPADNLFKEITYIAGGSGIVAAIVKAQQNANDPITEKTYYIHTDYTGSVCGLSANQGIGNTYALAGEFSYDPWGRLRSPEDWVTYLEIDSTNDTIPAAFFILNRGYTGHEHLEQFGLINMNARLYDARLARFLGPDPVLQAPNNIQNYNKFSYVLNNPLVYKDPNGKFILEALIIAGLLLTDVGYDIQKAVLPIALHINLDFGTHGTGIGLDVSVGIPQLFPISYRYDIGASYYFDRVGGYGAGWQVRNGAEWSIGLPFLQIQYGGMRYRDYNGNGLQSDQVVHTAQLGVVIPVFFNASYSNDTPGSFGLPLEDWFPFIPDLRRGSIPQQDRLRTASGNLRLFGLFDIGFFLHTGEGDQLRWVDTDGDGTLDTWAVDGGTIGDANRSNGVIYIGFAGFKIGWDSEDIRHALQNRLAHDGLSAYPQYGTKYPWMVKVNRGSRFVFGFGGF